MWLSGANRAHCDCNRVKDDFFPGHAWSFAEPARKANVIHLGDESVPPGYPDLYTMSFNMENPNMFESVMSMTLITLVIGVMVVFGLILSNSVSDL